MRLGSRQSFLVLHTDPQDLTHCIELLPTFSAAVRKWTAGTRLSPVWGFRDFETHESLTNDFDGEHSLLFVGPVAPARLKAEVAAASKAGAMAAWASAGCFNVVIHVPGAREDNDTVTELIEWANRERLPY